MRVLLMGKTILTPAEEFAAGKELDVDFKADYDFERHQRLPLQFIFTNSSLFHDGFLQACFQVTIPVNRHGNPQIFPRRDVYMMTPGNPSKGPPFMLK